MTDLWLSSKPWHVQNMTGVVQGSDEWRKHKLEGGRIGSSQAAAVFPGVSSTCGTKDVIASIYGYAQQPCDPFVKQLMQQGQDMEPVLRDEVFVLLQQLIGALLMACVPTQFQLPERTLDKVQESSSPDLLLRDSAGNVAVVEIKYRAASNFDCGWEFGNASLGLTVWCQLQHQMFVTGICMGYVYSGARDGSRRLWRVKPSTEFREMFLVALDHLVNADEARKNPYARGAKAKLRVLADATSELVHRIPPQIAE